jgi:hypothetical protein
MKPIFVPNRPAYKEKSKVEILTPAQWIEINVKELHAHPIKPQLIWMRRT